MVVLDRYLPISFHIRLWLPFVLIFPGLSHLSKKCIGVLRPFFSSFWFARLLIRITVSIQFVFVLYQWSASPLCVIFGCETCNSGNREGICLEMLPMLWNWSTYLAISSKFCESSTDNVRLIVCAMQPAFLITFIMVFQMHSFIFVSVYCWSKYNESTFTKGSHVAVLRHLRLCEWHQFCRKTDF
jgi:hypothetical protein